MEKTEAAIDQLIGYFQGHGYEAAATYMRRAKIGMFGYVRRWLKWGLIAPRASSMVAALVKISPTPQHNPARIAHRIACMGKCTGGGLRRVSASRQITLAIINDRPGVETRDSR